MTCASDSCLTWRCSTKRSGNTVHWAITLINGKTLIDLLVQDEIGVKKKIVDYYELDESAFQAEESQEIEEADGAVIDSDVD
ncbi:MAG: hypothetical protein JO114_08290 [Planctomycetaceae bacterium]|nr:hypothetical protein [Planctomycetaceae bacterium]